MPRAPDCTVHVTGTGSAVVPHQLQETVICSSRVPTDQVSDRQVFVVSIAASPTTTSREWQAAMGTGLLRIGAGVALLRWRDQAIRLSGGVPTDRTMRTVFTYFGVRDITLGVSTLLATRPGADVSKQVAIQGAADAGDTAILVGLVRSGKLPRVQGSGVVALAGVTALANLASSFKLSRLR